MAIAAFFLTTQLYAGWKGPLCYPDTNQRFTITYPVFSTEKPGDVEVELDDVGTHELVLKSVTASKKYPDSHEIVVDHVKGDPGIAAVLLRDAVSGRLEATYEFEFRTKGCSSAAIIEVKPLD